MACAMVSFSGAAAAQTQPTSYTASFSSIDQHPPAPEWFQDAKLGIWFHWGAFTTPEYYGEWYPHYMYDTTSDTYSYHMKTYGDPFSNWPYDHFITGANDKSGHFTQFAPKLVSAGGKWDPDAWAQLFVNAGAWIAGVQMEHHDGFALWDSRVNEWNSLSKGPMLNLAKLHADAFRKRGLKIMAAFHHAYNFQGYWQNVPKQTDASLQKLYGQLSGDAENQLWLAELKEVVDEFQPDMVYQDSFTPQVILTNDSLLQFAAYYYNAALTWNKEVVATYKDGYDNKGEVYDYERGGPSDISNPYWATDDTVGPNTWGYVVGMTYYDSTAIIHQFIDRVSKNGNLLLNICPMADGTIPQDQQNILMAMGAFLKQFGTAIYQTRAWVVYGEGPTKMGGCSICAPSAGTPQDVRYTASKDGSTVYAILLGWPGNGKQVTLASVTPSRYAVGSGKVFLIGPLGGDAISLPFTQDASGLHVTLPSTQPYTAVAYAMSISKSGNPPAPTPTLSPPTSDGGFEDGGLEGGGLVDGSASESDASAGDTGGREAGQTGEELEAGSASGVADAVAPVDGSTAEMEASARDAGGREAGQIREEPEAGDANGVSNAVAGEVGAEPGPSTDSTGCTCALAAGAEGTDADASPAALIVVCAAGLARARRRNAR